jgi:hypothetical protein
LQSLSCSYLQACIKEVMRLYPAIPVFPREAAADDVLPSQQPVNKGEHGYVTPMLCYMLHIIRVLLSPFPLPQLAEAVLPSQLPVSKGEPDGTCNMQHVTDGQGALVTTDMYCCVHPMTRCPASTWSEKVRGVAIRAM